MTPCGKTIELFANEHSVFAPRDADSEEIRAAYDSLCDCVMRLARKHLTWFQMEILVLALSGTTQTEIGRLLGTTQSNIHNALFGCTVYPSGKQYGGIFKKLKKLCYKDEGVMAAWRLLLHLRQQEKSPLGMPPLPKEAKRMPHWPSKSA